MQAPKVKAADPSLVPPVLRLPPGPALAAARELAAAGLLSLQSGAEGEAATVLARHFATARGPGGYPFAADAEFLHAVITHHVADYFREFLEVNARTHHTRHDTGRTLKDSDIDEAAIELAAEVTNELGAGYCEHLYRYVGDETGLATYVFSRIRSLLLEEALKYNEAFLAAKFREKRARGIATAVIESPPEPAPPPPRTPYAQT